MSTTGTFKEFMSLESEVLGKVRLLTGPHTKGKPFEVHLAFTYGTDRSTLDDLKSFCGIQKGLDTVKFCYDKSVPAQITLSMSKDDVKSAAKAKAIAEKCVQRLIALKDRQHNYRPAVAVHSDISRWEHLQ